jgi:hypothetical protein
MQREENGLTGHNFQYAEKGRSEGTPFLFWQLLYLGAIGSGNLSNIIYQLSFLGIKRLAAPQ